MVSADLRTYISFTHIEQRIALNMNVHAQPKSRRGDLMPVIVTVIVAVVGTLGILNTCAQATIRRIAATRG
jgi:hypothetical protein